MNKNKYSDYKIFYFPEKIKSFIDNKISAPPYVRIKPINLCNHGCFFCAYSTGFRVNDGAEVEHIDSKMHQDMSEKDFIPKDKMFEILDDLKEIGTKAITYSGGGEPLVHPDIVEIFRKTSENSLDLSIITNGQNLAKERAHALADAKWVRISMDYSNPEEFFKFRNVSPKGFHSIIKNIENFAKIKSSGCDLTVNFIVHENNYKELFDIAALLKNSGIENVRFSPMYVTNFFEYHQKFADSVNTQLQKIASLIDDSFTVNTTYNLSNNSSHSPFRAYDKCYALEIVPVIGADLNIYTCHNKAYDKAGLIGSITNAKFSDVWFSKESQNFINKFNPKLKCLHECSADRKNLIINNFINTSHDNFI
jgi:MoaA/NifB/PqqE/SkfB family radical SAM enzyme